MLNEEVSIKERCLRMKVAIGNDHAGDALRDVITKVIGELGHEVVDFGTDTGEKCYTTPIAEHVANYVVANEDAVGILVCGSGVGMSIAANKVPGIRCVLSSEIFSAETSRTHNNTNILAMGARVIGPGLAERIVRKWLSTEYEGGRREVAYGLITELEQKHLKEAIIYQD